jgi:carnitine 3-dehydrogenase
MTDQPIPIVNLAPGLPAWTPGAEVPAPLELFAFDVPETWIDYHDHMSEAFYLAGFSEAGDPLFDYFGVDAAYRAAGASFYSLSWRLDFRAEGQAGDRMGVATRVLGHDAKRVHLAHEMLRGSETVARGEQILIHVDTTAGRSSPIPPAIAACLSAVAEAHAGLPAWGTEGAGLRLKR